MRKTNLKTLICGGILGLGLMTAGSAHAYYAVNAVYYEAYPVHQSENIISVSTNASSQKFIENMGSEAIRFLGDNNLSQADKRQKFDSFLNEHFAMDNISRFVMGPYWKKMSESQRTEYEDLFKKMVVEIYSQRFSEYDGQKLVVTSATPQGENTYNVLSEIVSPNGEKVPVSWRVRDKDGTQKIVDVSVSNVSMAISKKSEFSSIIQRGGGDPAVLIKHLKEKVG